MWESSDDDNGATKDKVVKEPRVICNVYQRFEDTVSEGGSQSVKDYHTQSSSNSSQNSVCKKFYYTRSG